MLNGIMLLQNFFMESIISCINLDFHMLNCSFVQMGYGFTAEISLKARK